jgi:hypothetical protein
MPPPDGIVSWWLGDGDALDIESGLDGSAVNGAAYGPGIARETFLFDGIANGLDDRDSSSLGPVPGEFHLFEQHWNKLRGHLAADQPIHHFLDQLWTGERRKFEFPVSKSAYHVQGLPPHFGLDILRHESLNLIQKDPRRADDLSVL